MRVAIVDDSATARMFIRRCLEIAGFRGAEIIEAEHGRDALEKIRHTPVDLLLTDLTMPLMDGLTLLRWLKGNPKLAELPVLVITSAGNQARKKELVDLGVMGVIDKPVSPAKLSQILQPLLSSRQALDNSPFTEEHDDE